MNEKNDAIPIYLRQKLRSDVPFQDSAVMALISARVQKAFSFLPDDILDLFLSGNRIASMVVIPDTGLPLGMTTRSEGPARSRRYTVVIHPEHRGWPEDRFIGAFLRELGHVVSERPPEDEWPQARGDRSRYKEQLECRADAMVWRWGLRHYSMAYLAATYPSHWADRIVDRIGKMLLEEN
ncbi:MAG: hypothetical protein NTW27_05255 [Deltaproteobacteria bacterium]|jgi:hypothetical protein|nr:hypothetical protein [Deltaproteobacteria bacterium]